MPRVMMLLFALTLPADTMYDGARVHYESYGTGTDAIIFIHGWTCDLTFWRGQAPVYEKRRSLLIDLPGHGQSDKPDVAYTQERFARAVEAAMRDARIERAVLVGHSMGGAVALTFLRLFPTKVKALVMVDAYLPSDPKDEAARAARKTQMEAFSARWRAPNYKDSAAAMIESMFSEKTTPAQRTEIRSKMLSTPQHVVASAFDGMQALRPPAADETYSLPVLAIMASGRSEARLRAVFRNLKYEQWQGSGHFLMLESPDRLNRALEDFLAALK